MKFEIKAYNLQEMGQRENQEDSLYPALGRSTNDGRLFILCDGVGGHEKGEVASATVCEAMSKAVLSMWKPSEPLTDDLLKQALAAAFDALDAQDDGEDRKMGTTMTFVCLHANGATVAHIGDSRVYQLRPAANGRPAFIVFRTQDHSLVNDLVRIGEITEEEAKHHPQKNVITRVMQPCQEHRVKADIAHLTDIRPGDYFYMCSDGMLEETTDDNILNIITMSGKTDEEKLEMLRSVTEENKDNHTAHLIHINKVEGAVCPPTATRPNYSDPQGTLVTAKFERTAPISSANTEPDLPQKKKRFPLIVGALVIVVLAIAGTFFQRSEKSESNIFEFPEAMNEDTVIKHIVSPGEVSHDANRPSAIEAESAIPEAETPSSSTDTAQATETEKPSLIDKFRLRHKATKAADIQKKVKIVKKSADDKMKNEESEKKISSNYETN